MKRALFGLAVLALVLTIPVQHGETQAAGAVHIQQSEYCESTWETSGNAQCLVSRCYDMYTHELVSANILECWTQPPGPPWGGR